MATSRYYRSSIVKRSLFTNRSIASKINNAVIKGLIPSTITVMTPGDRLDIMAGKIYGDAQYWWVLAAASGIGWNLQVPPGTNIRIPTSLDQVLKLL